MSIDIQIVRKFFPAFGSDLQNDLAAAATILTVDANVNVIRNGQYVQAVPIVLNGSVRVSMPYEDRELLLYYIEPQEYCVMSFAACIERGPSKIIATTETNSTLLLIPAEKLDRWIARHYQLNQLLYKQYNQRYQELIDTIVHLIFTRIDERIYEYLCEKKRLSGKNIINIRHKQVAADLGTAREVVTRLLKRLEKEGRITQHPDGIEIIG